MLLDVLGRKGLEPVVLVFFEDAVRQRAAARLMRHRHRNILITQMFRKRLQPRGFSRSFNSLERDKQ